MPISKDRWESIQRGQRNRKPVVSEEPKKINQNLINRLRAANVAAETATSSKDFENKTKQYERLFSAYEDTSLENSRDYVKNDAYLDTARQKNKDKSYKYAEMFKGATDEETEANRKEYEDALNKEAESAHAKTKADIDYRYYYSNQSREDMQKEKENLQKQYDAETDENKKYAIEKQLQRATSYDESLMTPEEVQAEIDKYQKIVNEYDAKYKSYDVESEHVDASPEEQKAYKDAKTALSHYKDMLNPAIVNEYDDEVYNLADDDMQAFSVIYQYNSQKDSDEIMGTESSDPLRNQMQSDYNKAYSYLRQKYTDKEIKEMSEKFKYVADRDFTLQTSQDIVNDISKQTGLPLGAWVGLGLGTAFDAINSPVKMLDAITQSLTGKPINVYDSTFSIANINNAIQQGIVQQSKHEKFTTMALGVYCSLVSMGATMSLGMLSGAEKLSLFFMGNSAASQTVLDMAQKGASNDKIIASAIATGVAEALFEKVSIEGWIHPENLLGSARLQRSAVETVKALFAQMGCEVSEELCTDIANEFSDYFINGANSNAAMAIEAYKNMGYSQAEAEKMYLMDFGEQLANTALSSVIISAVMGGGSVARTDMAVQNAVNTVTLMANTDAATAEKAMRDYVLSGQSDADADNIIKAAMDSAIEKIAPQSTDIELGVYNSYDKIAPESDENGNPINTKMNDEDVTRIALFAAKRGLPTYFAQMNDTGQYVDINGNVLTDDNGNPMFVGENANVNGIYSNKNGERVVYINPAATAEESIQFIVGHEVTHDLEGTKEYDKLKQMILDHLNRTIKDTDGTEYNLLERRREQILATYGENYESDLDNELIADEIGTMMSQEGKDLMGDIINGDVTWRYGLPRILDNIRSFLRSDSAEQKIVNQYKEAFHAEKAILRGEIAFSKSPYRTEQTEQLVKERDEYVNDVFKSEEQRKKITGSPIYRDLTVSDLEMYNRIRNRNFGEYVSYDELMQSDIIKKGEAYNQMLGKWYDPKQGPPTKAQLQTMNNIANRYIGSAKDAKHDGVAFLVLGLPSSGKSSVISKALIEKYAAFETDNDIIKSLMEIQFRAGVGANFCQEASSYILDELVMPRLVATKTNLVIPCVGKSTGSVDSKLAMLERAKYKTVGLTLVDIPKEEAIDRAFSRFITSGRYVSLAYINSINPQDIEATYESEISENGINENGKELLHARYNNNVPNGEKAIRIEGNIDLSKAERELQGVGGATSATDRASGGGNGQYVSSGVSSDGIVPQSESGVATGDKPVTPYDPINDPDKIFAGTYDEKQVEQFDTDVHDEYQEAIESGDEAKARRWNAAKARLLGAWSKDGKLATPLYAGTNMFGYLYNDPNASQYYSLFYATSDIRVATGYTNTDEKEVRRLSSIPAEINIYSPDGLQQLADVANKFFADKGDNYLYKPLTEEDRRKALNREGKNLVALRNAVREVIANNTPQTAREKNAYAILETIEELLTKRAIKNLHKIIDNEKAGEMRLTNIEDAMNQLYGLSQAINGQFSKDLQALRKQQTKYLRVAALNTLSQDAPILNVNNGETYELASELKDEVMNPNGIYEYYGFPGNNPFELVIEDPETEWTEIPCPPMGDGTYVTDEICQWAREQGYTSVHFVGLNDSATAEILPSDVWCFFYPNQMKSADPITYDSKGNPIPIENRYDLQESYIKNSRGNSVAQASDIDLSNTNVSSRPRRTVASNDTIRTEVLPDIGDIDSLSRTREKVGGKPEPLIGTGERRQNLVNRIRDAGNFLATKFVDSAQLVRDASLRHDTNAYRAFTNAKGSSAMTENALGWYTMEDGQPVFTGNRVDMTGQIVGNSIAEVFYPYAHADQSFLDSHNVDGKNLAERQKKHLDECQTYLVMKLNRDVIESTGRERISGYDLAESVKIIQDFESEYGKDYADALSRANREITDYVADLNLQSGTLTQEDLDTMRETYPNYVPTLREDGTDDFEDVDMSAGKQGVMGEQRKRATGGGRKLIPLLDAYQSKVNSAMRFGQRNIYFNNLLQTAAQDAELARHINVLRTIPSSTNQTLAQILGQQNGKANTYVAFTKDGGAVVFEVDNVLNTSIKDLTNPKLEVEQYLGAWQTINRVWRGAVTTKNPLFMVSNAFRDAGQAMLMSDSVGQYWKDYRRAIREMRSDSELYKQFQASGVMSSSISEGLKKAQNNNFFTKIEGMGEIVEMLPRFSAYLSQIEKYGNTYEGRLNAQFAAKDITTNFSQGGDWTKMLNRNGFNFLNANVQGLLQIGRKITDPLKNPSLNRNQKLQALGGFAIKMTALGFAPYVINAFLIGLNPDRKRDYDELSDSIKTQYLLFPVPFGDGNFIRIPYGRALVISTTLANLAQNAIEGKKIDVGESLKTIWDNVGVAKPSGLWTPVVDAHNNKTWYGGTLVNYTLAEREKKDQYDESTDDFSKFLGRVFNVSPKKVNYVLDQWSGFVGDFGLPLITDKYKSNNPIEYLTNPVVKRFTTDAVSNNDLYDTYNDMFTEVKKKAATDGSYYGAEQYFYSQSKEINSIWTQIHEVQRYKSLSQEEKDALQQKYMSYGSLDTYKVRQQIIRDMRKAINGIQRNTIENYDYIIDASSKYPITDDMTFSQKKTQTFKMNNDLFGSEYALQTYGGDTWDNAQLANTCGIDFESYAEYFANTVDLRADKDENGNTISGTLKKKKWEALSSMNLSEGQRAFLFALEYKISQKTNYYDSKALQKALNDYINTLPLSTEEKKYLKDNLK